MPVSAMIVSVALVLYSVATWSEKLAGRLKRAHLVFFWSGLVFDTIGTSMMIAQARGGSFNLHTATGYVGIGLMLVHTVWATVVLARGAEKSITQFHRFSIAVWTVWLFSFINGAAWHMMG